METTRTVGLYEEGGPSLRIEYRLFIGDKDVTNEYELMGQLSEVLTNAVRK